MSTNSAQLVSGDALGGFGIYPTVPLGSCPQELIGTDTNVVAFTLYLSELWIPRNGTLTALRVLNGNASNAGNRLMVCNVFDSGGHMVARTSSAGTDQGALVTFQQFTLTSTPVVTKGRYFVGVLINATFNHIRTQAAGTYIQNRTGTVAAYETALPAASRDLYFSEIPTAFVADVGPIASVVMA